MWLCDYPTSSHLYNGKNDLSMPNLRLNMMDRHEQSMLQQYVTSPVNLFPLGPVHNWMLEEGLLFVYIQPLPELVFWEIEKKA